MENKNTRKSWEVEPDPAFQVAWEDLRQRVARFKRTDSRLLWIFIAVMIILKSQRVYTPVLPWLAGGTVYMFVVVLYFRRRLGKAVNSFPCPRCKKQFTQIDPNVKSPFFDIDDGRAKCLHCQLPVWSENAVPPQPGEATRELGRFFGLLRGRLPKP